MQRRILLGILGLIAALVGLFTLINSVIVQRSFRAYNERHSQAHIELIPSILSLYYTNYGTWEGVELELIQLSLLAGTQVTIVDESGVVLASTGDERQGQVADTVAAYGRVFNITDAQGRFAGTAYVRQEPSVQTVDRTLASSLNRGLVISVIVAVVVGVGTAALLARSISRPILTIDAAARRIAAGSYGTQIEPLETRDEVAALATTFNQMSMRLEETEQLRRQLVADVSHDLRTPLTVLNGYLEGLLSGQISDRPTAVQVFQRMATEIHYLQQLVDSLATAAELDSNRLTLNLQPTALPQLLDEVVGRFAWINDHQAASLELQLPADLPLVPVDRQLLLQALYNLINNAVHHNPTGVQIVLGAQFLPDTQHLQLWVADDGQGIPDQEREQIFERFVRLDAERGREQGGIGMGLAIVRSVAEAHQGRVWVTENHGGGAKFVIELPVSIANL